MSMFVRSGFPFNYSAELASVAAGVACDPEDDFAQQQFKEECDINTIVKRFGLTGEIPGDFRAPISGDFTNVLDFQSAMNAIVAAEHEFLRLPPELRARFNNEPQRLMDFVADNKNYAEAVRLGLMKPNPNVPPVPGPVVDPVLPPKV